LDDRLKTPARSPMVSADVQALVRTIPDYPKPGILFRDVSTLLLDGPGFAAVIEALAECCADPPDLIAAVEARGFLVGAALALRLGCGVLMVRKDGKLPGATMGEDYALEYGRDRLAIHVDACTPGARVAIVDDILATGGTALAAARLVRRAGGIVSGALFLIDLPDLGGADALRAAGIEVSATMTFAGN
jgi:adenine phosphoribosyltransferase